MTISQVHQEAKDPNYDDHQKKKKTLQALTILPLYVRTIITGEINKLARWAYGGIREDSTYFADTINLALCKALPLDNDAYRSINLDSG